MITKSGLALTTTTAGLLLAGAWADYPELVTLGYAGLGALLTAAAWLITQPQLTAQREIRPRVFEGSTANGLLTVQNVGRRRSPPLLVTQTIGGQRITTPIPALPSGHSHQASYPLPTTRRGRYPIPPLELGQSDPLRILHRGHARGPGQVLHVYPRVHTLTVNRTGGPRDAEGPTASSAPPGGVSFHSLREYTLGDDWRLIHWRATARTGTLMARHLVIPDEPRQLLVLDTSAKAYTGTLFEDAVRVAASFCVAADQAGLPVELRTTGGTTMGELQAILEFLSVVDTCATDPGLLDVPADQGVALIVVTGRVNETQAELLTRARSRFLSASLAQLVAASPPARPRGVVTVTASTSTEFTASWNRLVPG